MCSAVCRRHERGAVALLMAYQCRNFSRSRWPGTWRGLRLAQRGTVDLSGSADIAGQRRFERGGGLLTAIVAWVSADEALEGAFEVAEVAEACVERDLGDALPGVLEEELAGPFDADGGEQRLEGNADVPLEEEGEMGDADEGLAGELAEGDLVAIMVADVAEGAAHADAEALERIVLAGDEFSGEQLEPVALRGSGFFGLFEGVASEGGDPLADLGDLRSGWIGLDESDGRCPGGDGLELGEIDAGCVGHDGDADGELFELGFVAGPAVLGAGANDGFGEVASFFETVLLKGVLEEEADVLRAFAESGDADVQDVELATQDAAEFTIGFESRQGGCG